MKQQKFFNIILVVCALLTHAGCAATSTFDGSRVKNTDSFRNFYYLKEELVDFCRENNLPVSGGKIELTDRIACFLDTGKVLESSFFNVLFQKWLKSNAGKNYEKSDLVALD